MNTTTTKRDESGAYNVALDGTRIGWVTRKRVNGWSTGNVYWVALGVKGTFPTRREAVDALVADHLKEAK